MGSVCGTEQSEQKEMNYIDTVKQLQEMHPYLKFENGRVSLVDNVSSVAIEIDLKEYEQSNINAETHQDIEVPIRTKHYGTFNINISYTSNKTIKNILQKVIRFLEQKYKPKKFIIQYIWYDSFTESGMTDFGNGDNVKWTKLVNKSVTDYSISQIIQKGLNIRVNVKYRLKISNEEISCPFMCQQKTTDPMKCQIYKAMKKHYKFNKKNYHHIMNFNHFSDIMKEVDECKYNQNCKTFKRLETGGNRIDDLCHIQLYRHPPRSTNIELQEHIHPFIFNIDKTPNQPLYEPTNKDKQKHSWNEKDGYLNALIQEVIKNGFASDLCLQCSNTDDCKHNQYGILQIVDQKMKQKRHKQMGSPLTRDLMLALILYSGCDCNYDLCASQRRNDYKKWSWFDYCLQNAITSLSDHEFGSFPVFTGLNSVHLDKQLMEKPGQFKTFVSASYNKDIATTFVGDKGMLVKFDKSFVNDKWVFCCDVSWISKFPNECEILFARSMPCGFDAAFKCKVIDYTNDIQTVMLWKWDIPDSRKKMIENLFAGYKM